jgi:hypothetical protein
MRRVLIFVGLFIAEYSIVGGIAYLILAFKPDLHFNQPVWFTVLNALTGLVMWSFINWHWSGELNKKWSKQ